MPNDRGPRDDTRAPADHPASRPSVPTEAGGSQGHLFRDWITVWQSELSALATDREAQENWQAMVGLMSATMQMMAPMLPAAMSLPPGVDRPSREAADDPAAGCTGPAAAPRAPSADAPFAAGNGELERLAARVAELERRLVERRPSARRRKS